MSLCLSLSLLSPFHLPEPWEIHHCFPSHLDPKKAQTPVDTSFDKECTLGLCDGRENNEGLFVNVWSRSTETTRGSAEPRIMRCLKEQEEEELAEAGNELCAKNYH